MCLLEFEEEETAIEMPCHHLFHSNCILPWLSKVLLPFSQPSPCSGPSSQAALFMDYWGDQRRERGRGGIWVLETVFSLSRPDLGSYTALLFPDKFLPPVPPRAAH